MQHAEANAPAAVWDSSHVQLKQHAGRQAAVKLLRCMLPTWAMAPSWQPTAAPAQHGQVSMRAQVVT